MMILASHILIAALLTITVMFVFGMMLAFFGLGGTFVIIFGTGIMYWMLWT